MYAEDFQNVPNATTVQTLTQYTGDTGQQYTANNAWLTNCNGLIAAEAQSVTNAAAVDACQNASDGENGQLNWNRAQQLSYALGRHTGLNDAQSIQNYADSAYTSASPGAGLVEFQTASNIPFTAENRFITFSVDVAALNCATASHPLLQFQLLNSAGAASNVGSQIDACSSTKTIAIPAFGAGSAVTANVGTYTSNGAQLFSGSSVGVRMLNNNGSGNGNDHSIDNIKILDVTPQLDKAFSPASVYLGQTSTLTFTVTNTSELAAKNGWSFTDALPDGLTVASTPNLGGSCDATKTATAGGTSIAITNGNLAQGETSCTITVDVIAAATGTYTNGPDNVTETGLVPPGDTTLTVTDPPAWTCSAYGYLFQSPNLGDDPHQIYQVDLVTGDSSVIGTTNAHVNAVGYNETDDYMYGWNVATHRPTLVASDGALIDQALPAGIPSGIDFNVGDVDADGHYWITQSGDADAGWYEIDYAEGSDTYGQVLSSGRLTISIEGDWVFIDGAFYAVEAFGTNLIRFDPDTGTQTNLGAIAGLTQTGFGAGYADAAGNLYVSNNNSGEIFRINPTTLNAIDLSTGPAARANDGVRCASAPIPTITVSKEVEGRLAANDQFTVGLDTSEGVTLTDATTSGTGTTASTDDWPASQGQTYTITDAMAAGSSSDLDAYQASVVCTDTTTGDEVDTGGDVGAWTLEVTTTDAYACVVTNSARSYSVTKTADTDEVVPGDTITYTVTVTNTGQVAYTTDDPASFTDDLSAVLDDATYNDDASNGATYDEPTLSWSGPLAVGATETITYTVTVNDPITGDSQLDNTVVTPPGNGGDCDTDSDNPACTVNIPSGSYTVAKTASETTVTAGDTVTYTVTVTNTGQVAYTAASPASFTDDLSGVLDDAEVTDGPSSGATIDGTTLSWSGPLAIGATATITYTVTVDNPDTGDKELANTVRPTGPGGSCDPEGECATSTGVRAFTVTKTSSPAGTVHPGDDVTYTVTVTNTGTAAFTADAPASFTDDLSAVLDDATYNDDASNGATYDEPTLSWSGPLAVGATETITYTVTVNDPDTGNQTLGNVAVPGDGGSCDPEAACETENLVGSYTVEKTSSATGPVHPGDTVTYTVTVTNTGAADYTEDAPASITDDLSKVLDDATYVADSATNGAQVSGTTLTWSGPLEVGGTQTITYKVKVGPAGTGDGTLTNVVTGDPDNGGSCTTEDDCTTTSPLQAFTVSKTADRTEVVPGQTVTYTVTVTNTGKAAYTADAPASFTDDLSAVIDDATYNGDASNGATYEEPTLSWSGPLEAGATETITYTVTVNDPITGDRQLDNTVVTPPNSGGDCPEGTDNAECTANVPSGSFTVTKTADTTSTTPGGKVTYTVTVTNTGKVAYTTDKPASFRDDLTNVLDDATYNKDASAGATVDGNTLTWSGPLKVGQTVQVTYSVTVNDPDSGNHRLVNAVVPTGDGGSCDPDGSCLTNTPVASFTVTKTVSTTDTVKPGAKVSYTVTVKNTGAFAYTTANPAKFTDDMSDVLDDATYNNDATNGATLQGTTLTWAGPLTVGGTVKVTYSVTVNNPDTGNHRLINTVDPAVDGGTCDPAGTCLTRTPITPTPAGPGLAFTGTELVGPGIGLALMLLALGGTLLVVRRRRTNGEVEDNA